MGNLFSIFFLLQHWPFLPLSVFCRNHFFYNYLAKKKSCWLQKKSLKKGRRSILSFVLFLVIIMYHKNVGKYYKILTNHQQQIDTYIFYDRKFYLVLRIFVGNHYICTLGRKKGSLQGLFGNYIL